MLHIIFKKRFKVPLEESRGVAASINIKNYYILASIEVRCVGWSVNKTPALNIQEGCQCKKEYPS